MVVLQKYYEFVDKPSSEVTKGWKVCHIIFYIITSTTGFAAYYVFNSLKQQFGDNCVLYPNITFLSKNTTDVPPEEIRNITKTIIDESKTRWGNESLCDFCQYVPIMSMIIGSIFLTFFVMCPRGGSRHSQSGIKRPWHIVLPSLLLTGIFAVIILVSSIKTKNGIVAFCAEFAKELNITECSAEIQQFSLKEPTFPSNTLSYINTLYSLLAVCVIAWFTAFILLLCRCCFAVADFKLMEVTISTIDDDVPNLEETEVLLEQNPTTSPISHV